jgi:hypothetical protein
MTVKTDYKESTDILFIFLKKCHKAVSNLSPPYEYFMATAL